MQKINETIAALSNKTLSFVFKNNNEYNEKFNTTYENRICSEFASKLDTQRYVIIEYKA